MVFQLFALFGFGLIAYQDMKDRMVQWVLFPLVGLFLALKYWSQSDPETFFVLCLGNLILVTAMLAILWLYSLFISKTKFLNTSFGMGDVLFLYAFALGFPPITFLVLLTSGIFFSLFLHAILHRGNSNISIPLAGYLSLFLMGIVLVSFFETSLNLYYL